MPADTFGTISCCTPVENSQFHGRTFQPCSKRGSSCVIAIGWPNVGVSHGPQFPLAFGFNRSQFTTLLAAVAVTVLAVLVAKAEPGLSALAVEIWSAATPRAAETFRAVLPLPKRSYAAPNRGLVSLQFTTFALGMV